MSTWSNKLKLEIFGSSHGENIGLNLYGIPKGYKIDMDKVQEQMDRRAPGKTKRTTRRKENDIPIITSGIDKDNTTTGEVITMTINNENANSANYDNLKNTPRPGHADYTAYVKYGKDYDNSGGSVFSGRMTAPIVFAGQICQQILKKLDIYIVAHISEINGIKDKSIESIEDDSDIIERLKKSTFSIIDRNVERDMLRVVESAMMSLDSIGGIIECGIFNMKEGYGGELFDGLESKFSNFLFAIPGVKGVEFGSGFSGSKIRGSKNNDEFTYKDGKVVTKTNNSGGILGGISNGMPIVFRVAFKPTSSIGLEQHTVNLETKTDTTIKIKGKHDPCIVPRAVPVVESAAAIVLLDTILSEQKEDLL